jgi:hypothetical protein
MRTAKTAKDLSFRSDEMLANLAPSELNNSPFEIGLNFAFRDE